MQDYQASLVQFSELANVPNTIALISPFTTRLETILQLDLTHLIQVGTNNPNIPTLAYPYFDEVLLQSRSADTLLSGSTFLILSKNVTTE